MEYKYGDKITVEGRRGYWIELVRHTGLYRGPQMAYVHFRNDPRMVKVQYSDIEDDLDNYDDSEDSFPDPIDMPRDSW